MVMTENQFALGFWTEDQQHSVVSCRDIIGEVQVNDTIRKEVSLLTGMKASNYTQFLW